MHPTATAAIQQIHVTALLRCPWPIVLALLGGQGAQQVAIRRRIDIWRPPSAARRPAQHYAWLKCAPHPIYARSRPVLELELHFLSGRASPTLARSGVGRAA